MLPSSLILVGGGKMGRAMLEGWLKLGLPGSAVSVLDPAPSDELAALATTHGFGLNPPPDGVRPPAVAVVAVKPQKLAEAAPPIEHLVAGETLLVSIVAGKTVAGLETAFPAARAIVRAMPNLPASIGKGATGAYATAAVSAEQRSCADALLACNGLVEWVDSEDAVDAVTALSGSGPAYAFLLAECMAKAGVAAGLAPDVAERLARATVAGAGALLDASPLPASRLREDVTSPGGTTAAALAVLMGREDGNVGGMAPLLREAVLAAKRRARELAG